MRSDLEGLRQCCGDGGAGSEGAACAGARLRAVPLPHLLNPLLRPSWSCTCERRPSSGQPAWCRRPPSPPRRAPAPRRRVRAQVDAHADERGSQPAACLDRAVAVRGFPAVYSSHDAYTSLLCHISLRRAVEDVMGTRAKLYVRHTLPLLQVRPSGSLPQPCTALSAVLR
jgi:hypothetical protein